MKTAISIPSYNHRYKNLLNKVNKNNELLNQYDVYVFLSNNDTNIDQYSIYNNLHLIKTDCETLYDKKKYIFNYLYKLGYEKSFIIDDDIAPIGRILKEGYKLPSGKGYKGINISLGELCNELVNKMDELNVSYLTTVKSSAIGFYYPGKILKDKVSNLGQFGLFNIRRIIESNINFVNNPYEHDDIDLIFQIKLHGLGIAALNYCTFFVNSRSLDNSSFGKDIESLMHINLYLKYRDGITLRVDKYNKFRIIIRWMNYTDIDNIPIKEDDYHRRLYELCKETVETKDFEKLKNFIKNR